MRKRNVHIQFWLDKKEAEAFQKKVKKSGLSREAYLRHLVNDHKNDAGCGKDGTENRTGHGKSR